MYKSTVITARGFHCRKRLFRWPQSDKTQQSNGFTNFNPIPNSYPNPNPNPTPSFISKPILKKKVLTKCHSVVSEITSSAIV